MSVASSRGRAAAQTSVFGQVMGLVALTLGLLTLGAYLGRNLAGGASIVLFIVGFVCIAGANGPCVLASRPPLTP